MNLDQLEQRVSQLEAIEAIRQLKHRYLASCDAKDPVAMRACFVDGAMHIDYGPVGVFDNADAVATDFDVDRGAVRQHHVEALSGRHVQDVVLAFNRQHRLSPFVGCPYRPADHSARIGRFHRTHYGLSSVY